MRPMMSTLLKISGVLLVAIIVVVSTRSKAHAADNFRQDTLVFEPNFGQADSQADYIARTGSALLGLRATEFSLFTRGAGAASALRVRFLGAQDVRSEPSERLGGTINDYRGSDAKDWHLNIPIYARIRYHNVYDGIDVAYHAATRGFEYDLIVAPGANPNDVRLAFEGANTVEVDLTGSLVATIHGGAFVQRRPIAYQEVGGKICRIKVAYRIESGNIAGFELGMYDLSKPLVIDPLAYSTFFIYQNDAMSHHIAIDSAGNAYVAAQGTVFTVPPTTAAVIKKFSPSGSLLWTNSYQGNGDIFASGIAVDASGSNVYVVGTTSADHLATPNAFSTVCSSIGNNVLPVGRNGCDGNSDAFIMKFDAAGNQLYSTYFGGPDSDTGNAIAVDSGGFVYITGAANLGQFPVKGTTQAQHSGHSNCNLDAYLAKFDLTQPGTAALIFSTLLGGDGDDRGNALAISPGQILTVGPCTRFPCRFVSTGTIYVAGTTGDTCRAVVDNQDSPIQFTPVLFPTTANAFQTDDGLLPHPFLTLLDTTGASVLYSTLSPGISALGVAVAPRVTTLRSSPFLRGFSNAVITGATPDFRTVSRPASQSGGSAVPIPGFQTSFGGGTSDAFVAEFDPTQQAGKSLVFFTYLGGSGDDVGYDIATDAAGNATVVGSTNSTNFPIPQTLPWLRPVQSALAPCNVPPGCTNPSDAFVATISSNGRAEGYATYLGGSGQDTATGVALCGSPACSGSIFVTGTTYSTDFPVTLGSYVGGPDGFVSKISFSPRIIKKPKIPGVH